MTTSAALNLNSRIAGLDVHLEIGEGADTSRFLDFWEHLFAAQATDSTTIGAAVRLVQCSDSHASIEIPASAERITEPGETELYRSTGQSWFKTRGMVCDVQSGSMDVALDPGFWEQTLFDQRNFMLIAMVAVLRQNGIFPFHGNGLVMNDTGVIVTGNSGAGKTTLTHSLIHRGWQFLADDAIALHSTGSGLVAWALRRGFSLTEEARDRTEPPPLWDRDSLQELGNGKFLAMPSPEFSERFTPSCTPSALFFSKVGHADETVIERIPDHVAFMSTFEQAAALLADPDLTSAHLDALRDLVNQCVCYRIVTGKDVISGGSRAAAVSERILEAAQAAK